MTYNEFCERVRMLCILHQASETSGMRTPQRNAEVGGHPQSKHLHDTPGYAQDIVLDRQHSEKDRREYVENARALEVWAVDEGDHIHCQWPPPAWIRPREDLRA